MNKVTIVSVLLVFGICITQAFAQDGIVTLQSEHSAEVTVDRLEKVLKDNGLNIFEKVNHREGATSVDMELAPTIVLIFGNPKLGTSLMHCTPTVAIDLPQKILVWEDQEGNVMVGYNSPSYLKKRHDIEGCDQELNKISKALNKFTQSAASSN